MKLLLKGGDANHDSLDGDSLASLSYTARPRHEVIEENISHLTVSSPGAGAKCDSAVKLSEPRPFSLKTSHLEVHPLASVLAPIPTSDAAADSVTKAPSKPPKDYPIAIRQLLNPTKRKHFPSS